MMPAELVPFEDYRTESPRFAVWCLTRFGQPPGNGLVDPQAMEELRVEYERSTGRTS